MYVPTRMNTAAPESPSQRYSTLLNRLIGSRDWPRALDISRAWLSEDPENAQAHLAAGQALVNLERHAEASPHLTKALAAAPNYAFAHRLASVVCFRLKNYPKADEHIQRAIELQPNDAAHWYHLAWMRYRHGALDIAARHAHRALELSPDDSHIFNLLALCQRGDGKARHGHYLRALELDPENGTVHNNLGIYHLNVDRNFAEAEACFRRALQIDPRDQTAQQNLFTALKHRSRVYQALRLPLTLVEKVSWGRGDRSMLTRAGLLALWFVAGKIFWGILILWGALLFPLQKAYEYLTLGDIRAKAGMPGARRGGLLGYRKWPFAARLGVFAVLVVAFWGSVYLGVKTLSLTPAELALVPSAVVLCYLAVLLTRTFKRRRLQWIARRSEKRFNRQMQSRD